MMLGLEPALLALACGVTLGAGFVKGAVGFAMPMIMISLFASFLPPETALAALILPTVASNAWQAFRDGIGAAIGSARRFWLYTLIVVVFIAGSAQLVRVLPASTMYLVLGGPIVLFAAMQLSGWALRLRPEHRVRAEILIGAFAGFVGGLSGVWGPPTVAYLTALDTPKREAMRIQGVIYGIGAVVLLAAHLRSGVLNPGTLPLSAAMVVPGMIGMGLGFRVSDRMDQARFRRWTLVVLVVAGLNLIRRGLMA